MSNDIKNIAKKFTPLVHKVQQSLSFIAILFILLSCGFLVYRIGTLTNIEPTQEQISEKLKDVRRPKIDQEAINQIQTLESENIEVQSLFKEARDNPFQD